LKVGGITTISLLNPQLPYLLLKSYLGKQSKLKERLIRLKERGWIKVKPKADGF